MTSPHLQTTLNARPFITKVRVPGKVILSGEHAVVYGTKALACAIQNYANAQVEDAVQAGVRITIADFSIDEHYSHRQLRLLAKHTQNRYQSFVQNRLPLDQVVQNKAAFFAAALGASFVVNKFKPNLGLHITLTTDLVVGGGMGSSAALVAAMLAAIFRHLGQPLSNQTLITKTTQSEHWQHGQSSGLDPFVCVSGGVREYQSGKRQGPALHIGVLKRSYLVSTGRPQSSTGECVEAVKKRDFDTSLWQQFSQVEASMLQALEQGCQTAIGNAVTKNQLLLDHIGIVPRVVSEFITHIEKRGGAAKICGAGSVAGDQGGLVWTIGIDDAVINTLCQQYGYSYQPMVPNMQGIRYAL